MWQLYNAAHQSTRYTQKLEINKWNTGPNNTNIPFACYQQAIFDVMAFQGSDTIPNSALQQTTGGKNLKSNIKCAAREASHPPQELQPDSAPTLLSLFFNRVRTDWTFLCCQKWGWEASCCRAALAALPQGMHSGRARWPRCHWSCSRSPSRSPSCSRSRCGCSSHPWSYLLLHCCAGKAQNCCSKKEGKQALPQAQV